MRKILAFTSLCAYRRHYARRPAKPWQRLYLRPDPQEHRSFRPILEPAVE
ncbi:MAG: hypothetical protein BMS9Abin12_2404 [Acidimicrobiia bacterium]|nr:MAG: hypothetical protein BMS9Abin12_2404 [Acidimicrobiia bacterium]